MLVVGVALIGSTQPTATAVTFKGIAMTKARGDQGTNPGPTFFNETSIWLLHNPPVGTYTVSVTATIGTNPDNCGISLSYFNCEQTSTADASNGTTGITSGANTVTVTTVENNSMVVALASWMTNSAAASAVDSRDTFRRKQGMAINLNGMMLAADSGYSVPTGAKIMTFNGKPGSGDSFLYTYTGVSIAPNIASGANLINPMNAYNISNVMADDGDYFIQYGSEYMIQEYEYMNTNNTTNPRFTWRGRTTISTLVSPFYVEIFNVTTSAWEVLARETLKPADIDFQVQVTQTSNLSNYYDSQNSVTFRTRQQVI